MRNDGGAHRSHSPCWQRMAAAAGARGAGSRATGVAHAPDAGSEGSDAPSRRFRTVRDDLAALRANAAAIAAAIAAADRLVLRPTRP